MVREREILYPMLSRFVMATIVVLSALSARSASFDGDLFSGFVRGWRQAWTSRAMARRSNRFRLETDGGNRFLRVDSRGSASALWRRLDCDITNTAVISWRWKVSMSLDHIENERRRGSDDYAARVAVMFDGKPFARDTPLLMYVWAGNESVGNVYPSPYTENAATIVLRSGDGDVGEWRFEERELSSDFQHYFGRPAERITGVALMVDTDNTQSEATAWFDELKIDTSR